MRRNAPARSAACRAVELTQELIDSADLVVAMSTDHQVLIEKNFGRRVPLYREIAQGISEAFLDVNEAVPN